MNHDLVVAQQVEVHILPYFGRLVSAKRAVRHEAIYARQGNILERSVAHRRRRGGIHRDTLQRSTAAEGTRLNLCKSRQLYLLQLGASRESALAQAIHVRQDDRTQGRAIESVIAYREQQIREIDGLQIIGQCERLGAYLRNRAG